MVKHDRKETVKGPIMLTTGLGGLVCSYFYGLWVGAAARRARAHGPPRGGSPTRGRGRGCAHHHKKVAPRARAGGGKALRLWPAGAGAEGNHIVLPPARVRTPAIGGRWNSYKVSARPGRIVSVGCSCNIETGKHWYISTSRFGCLPCATGVQQQAIVRYLQT